MILILAAVTAAAALLVGAVEVIAVTDLDEDELGD